MADGRISIDIDIESGEVVTTRKQLKDLGDTAGQAGNKDMKDLERGMGGVEKSASKVTSSIGSIIKSLGLMKLASGVFNMIKGSIDKAFGRIDTMEQFDRVMTTITGSAETASKALETTNEIVKGTGYGLDVAAQSVQNFVTRGLEVDMATKTIEGWGDAVAFYGDGSNHTFASVTDALSKMVTKGNVDMEQMNRLFDAGVPALDIYASAVGISTEEVADQISKGELSAESFMEVMNEAFANGTDGFNAIAGAAKEAGATWGATFDNMRAAVARGVTNIIKSIDELLEDNGLPTMRDMVKEFGSVMENSLKKVAEAVTTFGQPFLDVVKNIKQAFEGDMSGLKGIVQSIIPRMLEWLQNDFPSIMRAGISMILNFINGIESNIDTVSQTALALLGTIVDTLMDSFTTFSGAGRNVIVGIVTGILENLPTIIESVGNILLTIADGFLQGYPDLMNQGYGLLQQLITGIKNNIGAVTEVVLEVLTAFIDMIVTNLPFILEKGVELLLSLVDGIIDALPQILEAAITIVDTLLEVITENLPTIIEMGIEMLTKLVSGIAARLPEIATAALDIVLKLIETITEHLPEIITAGVDIILSLVDGIFNAEKDLKTALLEVAGIVTDKIKEIDLWEIGKNIIQGLWGGMKSMGRWLSEKISGFVGDVEGWFKDKLGIASPSRLFRDEIGRMIPAGIEVGIRAGESELKMTTDRMLEVAMPAVDTRTQLTSLIPSLMPSVTPTSTTNIINQTAAGQQSNQNSIQKLSDSFIQAASAIAGRPVIVNLDGHEIVQATVQDMSYELAHLARRESYSMGLGYH